MLTYVDAEFTFEESKNILVLKTKRKNKLSADGQCDYYEYYNETRINPIQMIDIAMGSQNSNENIGLIKIRLLAPLGKEIRKHYSYAKINNNTGECYNFGLN